VVPPFDPSGMNDRFQTKKEEGFIPLIFYDQLGCGRSDQPDDVSLWHLEGFVREVDEVRKHLGLESLHLLGQSWGGFLAIEYLLSKPTGIQSVVLADTSASVPQFAAEVRRLRTQLPADVQAMLCKYGPVGDFHHPDYQSAVGVFYREHVFRRESIPECLLRTLTREYRDPNWSCSRRVRTCRISRKKTDTWPSSPGFWTGRSAVAPHRGLVKGERDQGQSVRRDVCTSLLNPKGYKASQCQAGSGTVPMVTREPDSRHGNRC